MSSQFHQSPDPWLPAHSIRISRYMLLVPEAPLLIVLLIAHLYTGNHLPSALAGLALAGWFALRVGLLWLARRHIAEADYSRAGQLLKITRCLHPFSADVYTMIGILNLARGQTEAAIIALQRAINYFPGHSDLHTLLSGALLEHGEIESAFLEARRAISFDPQNGGAYLHLASTEQALGTAPEITERHLRQGLERCIDPADEAALRCALADLLSKNCRQHEAQLVLAGITSLLERCPPAERAGLHFYLGELYRQIGEADTARGHFHASEHLDPHGRHAAAAWRAARS